VNRESATRTRGPTCVSARFGAPVEPEVNSTGRECLVARRANRGRRGQPLGRDRERSPTRAIDVEDSLGGKVECDLVEQRPHGSVGDDQLAIV